jgi:BirA family biotin operon repressor/biotin-[acetyl-CoA-carboxylase] ligase
MINGKKCAGILVEMTAEPLRVEHILVGVGINVNYEHLPADLADEATSLRLESGRAFSRLELLISVLRRIEHHYNQFLQGGAASVVARFEEMSSYARGKHIRVSDAAKTMTGVTEGLTPEGVLLLRRSDGGVERVIAGMIRPA